MKYIRFKYYICIYKNSVEVLLVQPARLVFILIQKREILFLRFGADQLP